MALNKQGITEFVLYTLKSELNRVLSNLEGMIKGIAFDGRINDLEIAELSHWYQRHKSLLERHGFDDLVAVLNEALKDGILSAEERADIIWVCGSYTSNSQYYDLIVSDIQTLNGLLHGIIADNEIELSEIERLNGWLYTKRHLYGIYPYDELRSIIMTVLEDGKLSEEERNMLKAFFGEFVDLKTSANLNQAELQELKTTCHIAGVCSVCPQITIPGNMFCFTGRSARSTQVEIKKLIESAGGRFSDNIVKDTAYLIVGNEINPCWPFACYGRKVEQAVKMRKSGSKILLVHENDFWHELQQLED